MSLPGLRGVLFDKDGTLFGFQQTWAPFAEAVIADLADRGADPGEVAWTLGFDRDRRLYRPDSPVIAETAAEVARLLERFAPDDPPGLAARLDRLAAGIAPVPATDLRAALSPLAAAGLRLGVVTNDSAGAARAHLVRAGVADLFDPVIGYDSGHGGKPDPGPLLAGAAAWGLPPDRIAMVGDSAHDLVAGRAAGMVPVGVLTGPADRAALAPLARAVLPSIADLTDLLEL
ncbi:HAD family hydrolase [Wenxinia saemankumensis]|uniref:phosphoglycolate phosphatase n=1 Tax=Wenxinia saemankumensis TaxID=1447782 RepID=A0A1M6CTK1_9RHOB|nr:HAD family hydrolase [Wenxinia saemankumensis]SHI64191.1 phosphoglycolate phosphatase [Wenxinia saemankumensis]